MLQGSRLGTCIWMVPVVDGVVARWQDRQMIGGRMDGRLMGWCGGGGCLWGGHSIGVAVEGEVTEE